ncbi:hypothetical protein ES332_A06G117100v1 [Gossypium tomentosum]|uniref:Transmembrane protein n=1 Tax=Gossypium tomentosum TaxID=34277 RepID=A0A5D2Q2H2_GOSTO|nr:hypothetical protein ES332_A06G117100v1 [Gossypium tomentosum]
MSYRFGISKTFSDFSSVLPPLHSCSPFSSLHRSGFVLPFVLPSPFRSPLIWFRAPFPPLISSSFYKLIWGFSACFCLRSCLGFLLVWLCCLACLGQTFFTDLL